MRFAVDAWAPEYGASVDDAALEQTDAPVDLSFEVPPDGWAPLDPAPASRDGITLLFVDGVQRMDARVWITGDDGVTRLGVCATYAAGAVRCDGAATVEGVEVRRGLFTAAPEATPIETSAGAFRVLASAGETAEELGRAVQQRMSELEVRVAEAAPAADLVIVDGPLRGRQHLPGAVGYVKSHRVGYLPDEREPTVAALAPGQRTPLFLMTTSWSRFSWYLRLPGASGHPWAGVVRCEASADLSRADVIAMADRTTALLPAFASTRYKDARAPQNLYPIGGLERTLRRHMGDRRFVYRALQAAAGVAARA